MKEEEYKEFADDMVNWFDDDEHYSVVHYATERGISKKKLFEMAKADKYFEEKLEYALSVQEFKLSDGAITGTVDRQSALKMLETYNGWKSDISVYQKVEQSLPADVAKKLSDAIEKLDKKEESKDDLSMVEGLGEVLVSVEESAESLVGNFTGQGS